MHARVISQFINLELIQSSILHKFDVSRSVRSNTLYEVFKVLACNFDELSKLRKFLISLVRNSKHTYITDTAEWSLLQHVFNRLCLHNYQPFHTFFERHPTIFFYPFTFSRVTFQHLFCTFFWPRDPTHCHFNTFTLSTLSATSNIHTSHPHIRFLSLFVKPSI